MNHMLREIEDWVGLAKQADYNPVVLADLAGCSLRHLERHFARNCGKSPRDWLTEVKVWTAVRGMRQGNPVKVAAAEAGFSEQSHFYRSFKKLHGSTPGQFLARIRQSESKIGPPICEEAIRVLNRLPGPLGTCARAGTRTRT